MLTGWLDHHRAILLWKCEGLTDDQLRQRSVPPSGLSLLGLVRHMAEVERGWFRNVLLGEDLPALYPTPEDPDADFNAVDGADVAEASPPSSGNAKRRARRSPPPRPGRPWPETDQRTGAQFSLRWILTHMIEEYARHNGHADLLRERIDGATGD